MRSPYDGLNLNYDEYEDEFIIDLHGKRCNKDNIRFLALTIRAFLDFNLLGQVRIIHGFSKGTSWSNVIRNGRLQALARKELTDYPRLLIHPKDLGNTVIRKC
jgi:hypothetical protein